MPYIKKLVMHGFKSFARKTELPLTSEINVVIGPNGSGKSNITDALCFVLGRISAKSMRAARASNLIFAGTSVLGPSKEAIVEIYFSNDDGEFSVDSNEVIVKRILRKNGQSIYKLNGKTSTRQDILAVLAQAGIDPNGFNIILQNEIQGFATGSPEDRRKLIEEVAGISIYESRKEKSMRELEKTSEKLKEIEAILRERTSYLNNLLKEKEMALKKKTLEADLRRFKANIIYIDLTNKKREKENIEKKIGVQSVEIEKYRKKILVLHINIESFEEKINNLNSDIQKQTGFEQEMLNKEISDVRADIAVFRVRSEGYEKKIKEISRQKSNFENIITENEGAILQMRKESPTVALIQKELERKKKQLEVIETERKKHYMMKSELSTINDRVDDKKKILLNYENESEFLLKQINSLILELYDRKTTLEVVDELRIDLAESKNILDRFNKREMELEKNIHTNKFEIKKEKEIIDKIGKLDVCPLCKSQVTEEHIKQIGNEIAPKINKLNMEIDDGEKELSDMKEKRGFLSEDIDSLITEIQKRQSDLIKLKNINEKEEQVKLLHAKVDNSKVELRELLNKKNSLDQNFDENSTIEEKYETLKMEVQDISIRNKENLDSDIQYKQRELDRATISIKQLNREDINIKEEILVVNRTLEEREATFVIQENKEEELRRRAEKFIVERDSIYKKQRELDREVSSEKTRVSSIESTINNLNVERARVDAQIQNLETDILEYPNIEMTRGNRDYLLARSRKTEDMLARIGTVNMRALEVYEQVKDEYESIRDKVETITNEKGKIMKIVHKIDIEKKKVFLNTFEELNEKFMRNFSQISSKGQVYLELQNRKEPFSAGIDIILKTGHGKYFDIKSLSGGEKTMVALSLIFAIQELRPYCFYILDEIDASLDKRNASRLAGFLKKYARKGQYIVISHNDEIITSARTLFGVSMHDGVSKLIGLKM